MYIHDITTDVPKIQLSVYPRRFTTYDKPTWSGKGWKAGESSIMDLANLIYTGWPVSPGIYRDGHRKTENFIRAQLIGVDLDKSGLTLRQLGSAPSLAGAQEDRVRFFQQQGIMAHETKSHTEENPRTRIIFSLNKPVEDADLFRTILFGVNQFFGEYDKSCIDPSRWFWSNASLAGRQHIDGILLNPMGPRFLDLSFAIHMGRTVKERKMKARETKQRRVSSPNPNASHALEWAKSQAAAGQARHDLAVDLGYMLKKDGLASSEIERNLFRFRDEVDGYSQRPIEDKEIRSIVRHVTRSTK